ncbi:MAG: response regulator, partial [Magnetococcales bacterium]|nr:response regulator [Magnetococcales bacterium]
KVIPYQQQRNEIGAISRSVSILQQVYSKKESQQWVASHITALSLGLQQATTFNEFSQKLMLGLAPLVGAGHGLLFTVDADQQRLTLIGGYGAVDQDDSHSGPIAQCLQGKKPIVIAEIPDSYIRISSGLGAAAAKMILLQPVLLAGRVVGVIELASFRPFSEAEQALIDGLMPAVAMGLAIIERSTHTQALLTATRQQALQLEQQAVALEAQKAAIAATELWYRGIVELAPDGLLVVDAQATIILTNPRADAVFGYDTGELIGQAIEVLVPMELHSQHIGWRNSYIQSTTAPVIRAASVTGVRKDGSRFPVELGVSKLPALDGRGLCLCVSVRDITEKKQAEDRINYQRATMRALIDSIPDPIYYKNPAGVYLGCNNAFADWVGAAAADIIGHTDHDLFQPEVASHFAARDADVVQSLQSCSSEEWLDYPDGRRVLLDTLRLPFWDSSGQLLGLLSIGHDVTERKAVEEAIRQAKELAESATKMKSDFLANMSHEIRTPMNAIIGMSYLALQTELTNKQRDYLTKIQFSSNNLLGIINDILDFSKIEAGKLVIEAVEFKLDDVLDNLANMVSIKAEEKGLEILFYHPPEVPNYLIGDPLRLGQILVNLTNNAVKFTKSGEVFVGVQLIQEENGKIQLQFTVRDTGIGMTAAQADKLFQAFSQADTSTTRQYGGTGLGLSICKGLVEKMGGSIWVESLPGQGSKFIFTVWLGQQTAPTHKMALLAPDLRGMRTLVVDDHPQSRQILSEMLATFSFDCDEVDSGEAAVAAVTAVPYQLVVMDWKMAGMDGFEAAQRIKEDPALAHPPAIILVTAYGRQEVVQQAHQSAIDGFLLKPVTPSLLLNAIMNIFSQERLHGAHVGKQRQARDADSIKAILGARVLLAEDNAINQQVATELLEGNGLVVTVVNNGREAVAAATQHEFDIILMDIQMPEMDGFQATAAIRQQLRFRKLPILAMTAHAMAGDRDKSLAAGMDDHITKPIDPDRLFEALVKWIPPRQQKSAIITIDPDSAISGRAANLLDHLPGIDQQVGLRQVGNNRPLFIKLLQEFRHDYLDVATTIQTALEQGEQEQALRLVHTVKGIAGSLGAIELHHLVRDLETAIKEGQQAAYTPLLQQFEQALPPIFQGIAALKEPPPSLSPSQQQVDVGAVGPLLMELAQLLHDGHSDAAEKWQAVKTALNPIKHRPVLSKMEQQINNYEFDDALVTVSDLANALGIVLDPYQKE